MKQVAVQKPRLWGPDGTWESINEDKEHVSLQLMFVDLLANAHSRVLVKERQHGGLNCLTELDMGTQDIQKGCPDGTKPQSNENQRKVI